MSASPPESLLASQCQPPRADIADWSHHWAADNQQTLAQRFFSVYRKVVFARTVAYFIQRYFPPSGLFVEAGSGTAETSSRIDKRADARILTAVDIVAPVLLHCHPVMNYRVGGDIFQLPFRNSSLDGVWNVGVMEHFTHTQIDQIMHEFHRVLKPGAPLLLLWPGVDSAPQRLLRLVERGVNLWSATGDFRFHPPEISQLKSAQEGRAVLQRNHFDVLEVEPGWRSLFAFKTLVGAKRSG